MLGDDLRILLAHFLEYTLPQPPGVGHGIRLVAHEHALARTPVILLVPFAIFESIPDHALDAFAGVDVLLHRNLIGRSRLKNPTGIHINAFSVFPHDNKIDVLGLDRFQWA